MVLVELISYVRDQFEVGADPVSNPLYYSEVDIVDQVLTDLHINRLEIFDLEIGRCHGERTRVVPLVVEIPIFREGYTDYATADAFYDLDEGELNLSVDDNYRQT